MENRQLEKESFAENKQKKITDMHFEIQMDTGNLLIPGKLNVSKQHRILYCRSNSGAEFSVGEAIYRLQRGDILLIRPNVSFYAVSYGKAEEGYAGFLVTISDDYVRYVISQLEQEMVNKVSSTLLHTRGTLWEDIDELFARIYEEYMMKAPGWETIIFGSSLILMIRTVRLAAIKIDTFTHVDKAELLNGILSYVENNLSEKITLEGVASRFFVSASTVTHLFQKKMNISFYKYVMNYRLWKAKNLILEGQPMEKIASSVGFNDYSAFYRAFKQEFGMSPRQYYKDYQDTKNKE